jgi:FixJ family two-component response regulator
MAEPRNHRPVVVVVEDDRSLLSALTFALDMDGYDVRAHREGRGLVEAKDPIEADCLVLDLRLPGLDGLSLLAVLRKRKLTAPAILITTNPDQNCRRMARRAGAIIVEKPLMDGTLRHAIAHALAAGARGA